jgi:hypothetical protein
MSDPDCEVKRVIVLDRPLRMKHRPDTNPYTAGEERAARERAPTDLFRQLADEPHNSRSSRRDTRCSNARATWRSRFRQT